MSDVLLQNAFKELTAAQTTYLASLFTGGGCTAANFTTNDYFGSYRACGNIIGAGSGSNVFSITQYWCLIPQMCDNTTSNSLCIRDFTSGCFRCGNTASWTVPAGVTCAQFQLWGPGGGTSSVCCCGGSPFGATGAYASVIMPVTPGSVYTLTAGCAYCCYATQTTHGIVGTVSSVTGPGLTNFCAMPGNSDITIWKCSLLACGTGGYQNNSSCQMPSNDACGPESCSGWNYCWDSAADNGFVSFAFSCYTKFYGTATGGTVYGLNGMFPELSIGDNGTIGFTKAAPVFGYINSSSCCLVNNGNSCFGCTASGGTTMQNPGSGGFGGYTHGGCNACGGDSGRMGMVCVRWK